MNQRDQRISGAIGAEPDVPEPPSNASQGADSRGGPFSQDGPAGAPSTVSQAGERDPAGPEPYGDPGIPSPVPGSAQPGDTNGRDRFQHDGEARTVEQPTVEAPDPPGEASVFPDVSGTTGRPGGTPNGDDVPGPSPTPPPPPVLDAQGPPSARHLRRGGLLLDRTEAATDKAAARRRVVLISAAAAPVALIAFIIVAWAIDNAFHAGQVHRNVEIAGHAVGGATEESLPGVITTVSEETGEREVVVVIKGEETETTASDLGVGVDEQATVESADKVGRTGSLFLRPFRWVGSLFSPRQVSPVYTVSETQVSTALQELQNAETADSATPVEPRVELANGEFVMVPGRAGTDLDVPKAASDLLEAVEDSGDSSTPIVLTATTAEVVPRISDQQAVDLANQANSRTEQGLTLVVDEEHTRELQPNELRDWIAPVLTADEPPRLDFDAEAADARVSELFSDLSSEPKNASVSMVNGKPRITDGEPGYTCCGEDVGARVWQVLQEPQEGEPRLALETDEQEPEYTKADIEAWGIKEPIGGSRAWRSGQGDISHSKPGFTTFEVGSGGRAHNIRRMADEVNGAIIPPGGQFSINDHVGARQCPPYQKGGAIVDGEIIDECGGGTSQFATTMFNAAYWAGMDISGYKSHSRYFSRYPRGREATMGVPGSGLDVVVTNNTPHGVLIQTSWEGDTVTVTFWSSSHFKVADQGITEDKSGNCERVTNTRKRTAPNGDVQTDKFYARYSTVEGETC